MIVSDNMDVPSAKVINIEEECLKIEKEILDKLMEYIQVEKEKLDIMQAKFDMKGAEQLTSLF